MRWVEEVMERGNPSQLNADGTNKSLSFETAKQYVKAAVDLHVQQKSSFGKDMVVAHPRGDDLKAFEKNLKRECRQKRSREYNDRGVGSIQDGYSYSDLINISKEYLNPQPRLFRQKIKECTFTQKSHMIRDRMVFLMNHMMLLRGEISRYIRLTDLFPLEFPNEGPTRCPVLVFMITTGKMNQECAQLYSAIIRHKDVDACALGAVGLYLFQRFHLDGESFPTFTTNEEWFDIKLVKGQDRTKEIAGSTQYDSINKVFEAVGINSTKKTHSGRGSGAREAELNGASLDHIRRVGKWDAGAMEASYLTNLPRAAISIIHGFPEQKGCYWLPRACITPSTSLQRKIFPDVEMWQQKMENGEAEETLCGTGFLKMLQEMRTVILQDAVLLREHNPGNVLFNHPIFQSDEFKEFAAESMHAMRTTETPLNVRAQEVMPHFQEQLKAISSAMNENSRKIDSLHSTSNASIENQLSEMILYLKSVDAKVTAVANGQQISTGSDIPAPDNNTSSALLDTMVNGTSSSVSENVVPDDIQAGNIRRRESDSQEYYTLNRDLRTVASLWEEWTEGLVCPKEKVRLPSVTYLDDTYGTTWRSKSTGTTLTYAYNSHCHSVPFLTSYSIIIF